MAKLLHYKKYITKEGDIIKIMIWEVEISKNFPRGLKYSFVYIHKGIRVFGCDNERAKGDHIHLFDKEEAYHFINIEGLYEDFEIGISKVRMVLYGNKEN